MSSKRPWFKFYTANWRGDPGLRLCSAAARGLWIEMLTLMHDAEPYGTLTLNGKAIEPALLAELTHIPAKEVTTLVDELRDRGVFGTAKNGVIFSRKMKKDRKISEKGKENAGKRWGKTPKQPAEKPQQKPHPNGVPNARAPDRSNREQNTDAAFTLSGSPEVEHGRALSNGVKPRALPDDFRPDTTYARQQGLSEQAAKVEVEAFLDYWRAKGKDFTKRDWPATWRTWVRRAADRPPSRRAQGPPPGRWSVGDVAMRRLREMEENDDDDSDINKGFRQGDAQADAEKPRHVASTAVKIDRRD